MSKGILFTILTFIFAGLYLTLYILDRFQFLSELSDEMIQGVQILFIVLQFSTFLLDVMAIHFLCKEKGIKTKDQVVATVVSISCCGPIVPLVLIFQAPGKNGSSF